MARRKSKGRSGQTRSAAKKRVQRSKRTTIIIKTRGRRSKPTIFHEEDYEEEW